MDGFALGPLEVQDTRDWLLSPASRESGSALGFGVKRCVGMHLPESAHLEI